MLVLHANVVNQEVLHLHALRKGGGRAAEHGCGLKHQPTAAMLRQGGCAAQALAVQCTA